MNCSQFRLNISPYLDLELSFAEQKKFSEHRDYCPDCSNMIGTIDLAKKHLSKGIDLSLPSDFTTRLRHRLSADAALKSTFGEWLTGTRIWGFSPVSFSGFAAVAAAAVFVAVSLFQTDTAPILAPRTAGSTISRPVVSPANQPSPQSRQLLTSVPADTSTERLIDSTRRDFSGKMKLVSQ